MDARTVQEQDGAALIAWDRGFLFDASPVGLLVTDRDDVVLAVNEAFARMLGVVPENLVGAVFHRAHPALPDEFDLAAVRAAVREHGSWAHEGYFPRFDETVFWALLTVVASSDEQGNPVFVSQVQDLDEVHTGREALVHAARHDALTGLPNRASLVATLETLLEGSDREHQVAVLHCGLDQFKVVNDSLGHAAGDELLVTVADRLREFVRDGDHVARLGGDQFAVVLTGLADPQDAVRVAARLRASLQDAVHLLGATTNCEVSVGIAVTDGEAGLVTAAELLRAADTAMYRAKNAEVGGFQVFAPSMHQEVVDRLRLVDELRVAVERDEFVVHFQPIVRLEDGHRMAFEALVRWQHPTRGTLGPEEFLLAATECGLAPAIDTAVLQRVATFLVLHPQEIVAINVSTQRLDGTFGDAVARALARVGAAGHRLMVELREGALLAGNPVLSAELHDLESLGVTCIIDDFGSGWSALTSLHELPVRGLKMGTEFTAGLPGNGRLVASILGLAEGLDVECIATGVETAEQADYLRDAGWHAAQGWFFGGVAPEGHWFPVVLPLD